MPLSKYRKNTGIFGKNSKAGNKSITTWFGTSSTNSRNLNTCFTCWQDVSRHRFGIIRLGSSTKAQITEDAALSLQQCSKTSSGRRICCVNELSCSMAIIRQQFKRPLRKMSFIWTLPIKAFVAGGTRVTATALNWTIS